MSQPPPPPQLSPDGKFYWDGQAWQPMPAAAAPAAAPAAPAETKESQVLSNLPGELLILYPNRIEIERGIGFKKRESILLKAITDISVSAWINRLHITTSDGKKHTYNCMNAKAAREAILGNL